MHFCDGKRVQKQKTCRGREKISDGRGREKKLGKQVGAETDLTEEEKEEKEEE